MKLLPPDPVFFLDRDLGGQILFGQLREAGLSVERHDDHFPQNTFDPKWLGEVGKRKWVALTRNRRIRYTPAEQDMLMRAGVRCFFLIGKAPHRDLGEAFKLLVPQVLEFLINNPGPFMAKVYCNPRSAERKKVKMWVSYQDWKRVRK